VALAVEKGPFEAVIAAWQKTRITGRSVELTTLSAAQAMLMALAKIAPTIDLGALPEHFETAESAAGAAGKSGSWRRVRAFGASFIAPFLAIFAIAIVLAGTGGEGLAVYVLYQGSDSPDERQWVLIATLFMVAAVAVGPLLAYLRSLLESIFSGLKSEARTLPKGDYRSICLSGSSFRPHECSPAGSRLALGSNARAPAGGKWAVPRRWYCPAFTLGPCSL
jgi:hypothetical protein